MTRRTLALSALGLIGMKAAAGPLSGRRAPSFALPDSRLRYHDILDYRGKYLLIDFMLTDCPHCQTLAPVLENVKAKFKGKVDVLSIVTPPDTNVKVANFVATYGVTSPVLFDCGQATAAYLKATLSNPKVTLPHLFLLDPKGQIIEDWAYSEQTKAIFEGDALAPIIESVLAGGKL